MKTKKTRIWFCTIAQKPFLRLEELKKLPVRKKHSTRHSHLLHNVGGLP